MTEPTAPYSPLPSATATKAAAGLFAAGTMIGGRYRIVSLAGRGGMGEVYRAFDTTLDQDVALKFLPAATARDHSVITRFRNEVRVARQISHPNVCRVYDIAEAEDRAFLSMEYIDGEDLSSLLKRIGRLPTAKALEVAHKLCAGLASAHARGILHRDLKPANVMIDSSGEVRITDFGLAGLAEELQHDVLSGTPAYMSPEQLAGSGVSVRSDIYALGLVLYELLTGRRPFDAQTRPELLRMQTTSAPVPIRDAPPEFERVVMQCLHADPLQRPPSALALAAALPGGDALSMAVNAGAMPSPEIVAGALGQSEGMKAWVALALFAWILVGLTVVTLTNVPARNLAAAGVRLHPEALKDRARRIAGAGEYEAWGFTYHPKLSFFYRTSPVPLEPESSYVRKVPDDAWTVANWSTPLDPAPLMAGMVGVQLDPEGYLRRYEAKPSAVDFGAAQPVSWSAFLMDAGFEEQSLPRTTPQWTPPAAFDEHVAWKLSSGPFERIEAAAYRGKPVYFEVIAAGARPASEPGMRPAHVVAGMWAMFTMTTIALFTAVGLAWYNLKRNRADRRSALRLAVFLFAVQMIVWITMTRHVATVWESSQFTMALQGALWEAFSCWLVYLALEPIARGRFPKSLISWTRLLSGGVRDRLVGSDLLVGLAVGAAWVVLSNTVFRVLGMTGVPTPLEQLSGLRGAIGGILVYIPDTFVTGLWVLFLLSTFRWLLPSDRWAGAAVLGMMMLAIVPGSPARTGDAFLCVTVGSLLIWTLRRYGLLALVTAFLFQKLTCRIPLTFDSSLFYSLNSALALGLLTCIALFAVSNTLLLTERNPQRE